MTRRFRHLWFVLGLVIAASCSVSALAFQNGTLAATFTGEVVAIVDGDTIRVMHDGAAERIRLHGIDCPEAGQPFGTRAQQFTSALAFNQEVTVHVRDVDRYGRTVADIILPDGRNLNRELVAAGLAWSYERYAPEAADLAKLEAKARAEKRGLWSDASPMPPWEWRHSESGARRTTYTDRPRTVRARGQARSQRRSALPH